MQAPPFRRYQSGRPGQAPETCIYIPACAPMSGTLRPAPPIEPKPPRNAHPTHAYRRESFHVNPLLLHPSPKRNHKQPITPSTHPASPDEQAGLQRGPPISTTTPNAADPYRQTYRSRPYLSTSHKPAGTPFASVRLRAQINLNTHTQLFKIESKSTHNCELPKCPQLHFRNTDTSHIIKNAHNQARDFLP